MPCHLTLGVLPTIPSSFTSPSHDLSPWFPSTVLASVLFLNHKSAASTLPIPCTCPSPTHHLPKFRLGVPAPAFLLAASLAALCRQPAVPAHLFPFALLPAGPCCPSALSCLAHLRGCRGFLEACTGGTSALTHTLPAVLVATSFVQAQAPFAQPPQDTAQCITVVPFVRSGPISFFLLSLLPTRLCCPSAHGLVPTPPRSGQLVTNMVGLKPHYPKGPAAWSPRRGVSVWVGLDVSSWPFIYQGSAVPV